MIINLHLLLTLTGGEWHYFIRFMLQEYQVWHLLFFIRSEERSIWSAYLCYWSLTQDNFLLFLFERHTGAFACVHICQYRL